MTRDELLQALRRLEDVSLRDPEEAHSEADDALLAFINDSEVTTAFEAIRRWYA